MTVNKGFVDTVATGSSPTFLWLLDSGTLDLTCLLPFPDQDDRERSEGDAALGELDQLLAEQVDGDDVDRSRGLPGGLYAEFARRGYFKLSMCSDVGGRGLSLYNQFRFIERLASSSGGIALSVALSNSMSPTMMLPLLPPGPLRTYLRARVAEGIVGAFGGTGPSGQNNRLPDVTAVPTEDGTAYLLTGETRFTTNGSVADLICVRTNVGSGVGLAFVDTTTEGFSVRAEQEFMGLSGAPNAALSLDNVRVPREHVLRDLQEDPELAQSISTSVLVGRMFVVSAPATGIARRCLGWARDFVRRREIDGRPLGDYDEIQRMVATTAAEVYALDSVVKWCLLGPRPQDRWFELMIAKNITTMTAWRIVDRTMSLMGAQGYETESSKRRRGVSPVPLERAFRDLRGLRITANVDFQLDNQAAWLLISRYYAVQDRGFAGSVQVRDARLSPANWAHRQNTATQIRRFRKVCQELVNRHPDQEALAAREHTLILLGRIAAELFTVTAVLARTSAAEGPDESVSQDLAEVYCAEARHRLARFWQELAADAEPEYGRLSRTWLMGSELDFLLGR